MRSDLTCPVEVTNAAVEMEQERILCRIGFQNLSDRKIVSMQMNITGFDRDGQRIGGRLVRAAVSGEGNGFFSGQFLPDHLEAAVRIEASVEKIWFADGMMWRREERNVREYEPNLLPPGRELDRLRKVAGPDARGYAREDDLVWMCVCGRANKTSESVCMRCGRERTAVLRLYCFQAIDATEGLKERALEKKTREALQKDAERSAEEKRQEQKQNQRRKRRITVLIAALCLVAAGLCAWRWAAPALLLRWGDRQLADANWDSALRTYAWIDAHWPNRMQTADRITEAREDRIDAKIAESTPETLQDAMREAEEIGDENRRIKASLALADTWIRDDKEKDAEGLLRGLAGNEEAEDRLCMLVYGRAQSFERESRYSEAIAAYEELGSYSDAALRGKECKLLFGQQLMQENRFEEACGLFGEISGDEEALGLLRRSRYLWADSLEQAMEYLQAAQLFESLGFFEDAPARAGACRYKAGVKAEEEGSLDLAAEQFALAENTGDAAQRFETIAQGLAQQAIESEDWQTAIGWLEKLPRAEVLDELNRAVYAWADQLASEGRSDEAATEFASLGDYGDARERYSEIEYAMALQEMETSPEEALMRFSGLSGYRDSDDRAEQCKRAWAEGLQASGEYEKALSIIELITDRKESEALGRKCRYLQGEALLKDGANELAAAAFSACGTYQDAESRALDARYLAAADLEKQGEFQEAAAAFRALGGYSDAVSAKERCEDEWLKAPWSEAQMSFQVGDYDGVLKELENLHQEVLPERYQNIVQLYTDACLARAQELIGLGRPLDALPYLERIPENKTAKKRLNNYVYRILGRWKDTYGAEYVFRHDGSCSIQGKEAFFGGSGYEIWIGDAPYPEKTAYTVVSLRGSVLTLKDVNSKKTIRLTYLGEAQLAENADITASEDDRPEVSNIP